jgi:hypothetical protein
LQATKVGGEWRVSDEAVCKLLEDGMNVKKVPDYPDVSS